MGRSRSSSLGVARSAEAERRAPACCEVRLELEEADRACDWMDAVEECAVKMGSACGLDENSVHFLGVALREALVNALLHGRRRDGRAWVGFGLRLLPSGRMVMTVRDRGCGFDPASIPDPCAPENAVRNGGRGLFYMRQFVDRLSFSFPRQGGALVRLEKRLPQGDRRH